MKKIEDFIEENYPNFSSSDLIAELDDLYKLVYGEFEDGDSADQLLQSDFGGEWEKAYPKIQQRFESVYLGVLIKSIETHLEK